MATPSVVEDGSLARPAVVVVHDGPAPGGPDLLALTWGPGDVDLEQRTVTIAASYCLRRGELGQTKSGKARTVLIGPTTVARMREWRMAAGRPADGGTMFTFDPRHGHALPLERSPAGERPRGVPARGRGALIATRSPKGLSPWQKPC